MTEKKHITFFVKCITALFLGVFISFIALQRSDNFKDMLQQYMHNSFFMSFNCDVDCKIGSINLFSPKIKLDYVCIKSHNNAWSLYCGPMEIGFSWLNFFLSGMVDLYLRVDHATFDFQIKKNKPAILSHIMKFFKDSSSSFFLPICLKFLHIKKASISVQDVHGEYKSSISFASITKNMGGTYKTKVSLLEGDFSVNSQNILKNLSGMLGITVFQRTQKTYVSIDSKSTIDAQFLPGNKTCFITGKWIYDQGVFEIVSQDKSFSITPIKLYFLGDTFFTECTLKTHLKEITPLVSSRLQELSGKCSAQIRSEFGPLGISSSGVITLRDVFYKGFEAFSFAKVSFKNAKRTHKGFISFVRKNGLMVTGNLDFDSQTNTLFCNITNDTDIKISKLPYWKIPSKKATCKIFCKDFTHVTGACTCCAISEKLDSHIDLSSNIALEKSILRINGTINQNNYALDVRFSPTVTLDNFLYTDKVGQELVAIKVLEHDATKNVGSIKFSFIKSLLKNYLDYEIEGEGDLSIYTSQKKDSILCRLNFKNGSVSFPGLYNFLHNFKINFKLDPLKRIVIFKDSIINFHKGSIVSKKSVLHYNDSFNLDYIYTPLIYNDCFIHVKKDLFALLSGRLLILKQKNKNPYLQGFVILERSHLRRNIFSSDESSSYMQYTNSLFNIYLQNTHCDISVISKEPVRINTDFLSAIANVDISIKNKILDPQISGKINFLSGSLSFPYKNLDISKGAIYFLPHQSRDPLIELVAKNKISKYNIAMYLTGSFANHHMLFESSPPLSQEQVVALLIAGSAQESLNVVAPALIVQKVKDSLFGSGTSKVGKKNYLGRFLKPFKKIRIVPIFTDQTGRGGLRGALEVDINDRIRAFVEKNFSLSEDTRFEIEYLLSDDASVRAFRRENGDIGGEVEMRWNL